MTCKYNAGGICYHAKSGYRLKTVSEKDCEKCKAAGIDYENPYKEELENLLWKNKKEL